MKKRIICLLVVLFIGITTGCRESTQSTDDFITVDVTKKYPKKELILQDFLDVEYIPLETKDEFITTGFVQAIGKDV
ncbi:6-bladed beta-propeller, partial [Parabacteroides sp. PF5-9]|uniref:6-bladed beta-propeller n=1 Tax=Parabacteroides sp. PF5-9 TaxID=1742404 RepID=UPI00247621DF